MSPHFPEMNAEQTTSIPPGYWRRFRRLEWFFPWGTIFLSFGLVVGFSVIERVFGLARRSPGTIALISTAITLFFVINTIGILYYRFPCPRCGKSFLGFTGFLYMTPVPQPRGELGKKCAHCGLVRGATSTTEDKATGNRGERTQLQP